MSKFIIKGGKPLRGAVRLGGAKNASFKLMVAAAMGGTESRLLNLSHIGDVEITKQTLQALGVEVSECGERTVYIRPSQLKLTEIPQVAGEKSRASTLLAAYLLSKQGEAHMPLPGGDKLGPRPVDRHLQGFEHLGVRVSVQGDWVHMKVDQLRGGRYRFEKKTHTGTEAFLLAAVKAEGQSILENAGLEPEIDDLIVFLNKMGGKIKREAPDTIIIDGVAELQGAIHQVMPDRNEAVSYAVAALATKGDIVLENARQDHLKAFLAKVNEAGGQYEVADYGIRFWYSQPLRPCSIKTAPEPGFMTDWQPLWTILMTQVEGQSEIVEAVSHNRLQFSQQLLDMGAHIELFNPQIENPKEYYEFDHPEAGGHFHAAKVTGNTPLQATSQEILDIRSGATLTIAALIAQGTSILSGIHHIDRGYEKLDSRLRQLGADIERIE